ncbi:hypothetical protein ACYPKM_00145 [Pseudomonas aeruginosa]
MASTVSLLDAAKHLHRESAKLIDMAKAGNWDALLESNTLKLMNPEALQRLCERPEHTEAEKQAAGLVFAEVARNAGELARLLNARDTELRAIVAAAEERRDAPGGFGRIVNTATYSMKDLKRGLHGERRFNG